MNPAQPQTPNSDLPTSKITCQVCNNVATFDPTVADPPRSCPICDSSLISYSTITAPPPPLPDPTWQAAVTARNKRDTKKIVWILVAIFNPVSLFLLLCGLLFLGDLTLFSTKLIQEAGPLGIVIIMWIILPFAIIGFLALIAWLIFRRRKL